MRASTAAIRVALLGVGVATNVGAQTTLSPAADSGRASQLARLPRSTGERIRVVLADSSVIDGRLWWWDESSFLIRAVGKPVVDTVLYARVAAVQVGSRNPALGMAGGALGGGFIGMIAFADECCPESVILGGMLGAVVGAGVGGLIGSVTTIWRYWPEPPPKRRRTTSKL